MPCIQPICFCHVSSAKLLGKALVILAQLFSKPNISCKVCEDPTQPGYFRIFSAENSVYVLCYIRAVSQLFGSQAACKSVNNHQPICHKVLKHVPSLLCYNVENTVLQPRCSCKQAICKLCCKTRNFALCCIVKLTQPQVGICKLICDCHQQPEKC